MTKLAAFIKLVAIILGALALVTIIFIGSLLPAGSRTLGPIENIDGMPFATNNGATQVTQQLAHVDVYLREPVLLKQLRLKIDFDPLAVERLEVGVRADSFWLSYPREVIYDRRQGVGGRRTQEVVIPLTDKLADADRSVDVMFFAKTLTSGEEVDRGASDDTHWQLWRLAASVERAWPNAKQLKDYVKSILGRERII